MEEKRPNTPRNSTVAVSPEIGKKLERFCASCGITKKDFISLSLDYFQRYGINPAKHESPAGKSSVSCPLKPSDSAPLC